MDIILSPFTGLNDSLYPISSGDAKLLLASIFLTKDAVPFHFSDLPRLMDCLCMVLRPATDWNINIDKKLHGINPTVSKTQNVFLKRRDEVVITRCRKGHSRITHFSLRNRRST
jgi:hypothetical protein